MLQLATGIWLVSCASVVYGILLGRKGESREMHVVLSLLAIAISWVLGVLLLVAKSIQ